ncbi:hypothetical protein FRC06_003655 [Ceratobasidium sp. 370]|nr:hypothetical protein FRC06_003655 [Ceratobasidium sp. 370]
MSRNLSKTLRHWLKPRSKAIDNEKGIIPLVSKRPEEAINKFKEGFIQHTDASKWIDSLAIEEAPRIQEGALSAEEETLSPQGDAPRKEKPDNAKGEWTFHSPKPAPGVSMGYLHNANHRLITTKIISKPDLKALLHYVKGIPKYDEYTEIIVIGQKPTGPVPQVDDGGPRVKWELCFVDHFNRRFLALEEFESDPNRDYGDTKASEYSYREWMELVASGNSHYYKPSPNEKKQSLGRKIAQQIVWDYQTAHVVKDIDIEGAFSTSDCASLLSALQKKRVSDKQCQKMIKAVIQRFLHSTPISQRPQIKKNFDAKEKIGPFTTCGMALFFIAWTGPLLHVPFPYFRRLRLLSARADQGEYVPDLWKTFIKAVLKEWTDLNIILALILA